MKILNLYAGIGGNRKLWGDDHEVTAVENNESIAKIYQDFFPKDKVIIADAHEYLLNHFQEFDFIWSSPPCPTHSRLKKMGLKTGHHKIYEYPDMRLYQEILLLQHFFKGKYVVENVVPYYEALIYPIRMDRHCFWTNFNFTKKEFNYGGNIKKGHAKELQKIKGVNIDKYKLVGARKDSTIRSYINPEIGLHLLKEAFRERQVILKETLK